MDICLLLHRRITKLPTNLSENLVNLIKMVSWLPLQSKTSINCQMMLCQKSAMVSLEIGLARWPCPI